ncbi:MAG: LysR family transcriptional regulator [Lachnospiraceae bacterium]
MDISNLRYFATVAREQHMGRAAEELNITQPSLSVAIRRLEAELGYQLFDRVGRGIKLNEYGQIYLKGVTAALDSLSMSTSEMEEYKKSTGSLVKLSCSGSAKNSQLIDHLIGQGFCLKINSIPKDLESALIHKQTDLIITMGLVYNNHIEYDELAMHDLVFVAGKNHPLANQKRTLTLDELQHHLFCSMDTPNSLLNVFKAQKNRHDFQPTIAFFGRNSNDMNKVIMTGKYIGLMVKQHLPKTDNLQILSLNEPDCSAPIYLYWHKSQGIKANIQAIRREIIDFYALYDGHNYP